ncbi:MAG TPA: hypothetical protein VF711_08525, partial [Acidimicrobiales bacterium]
MDETPVFEFPPEAETTAPTWAPPPAAPEWIAPPPFPPPPAPPPPREKTSGRGAGTWVLAAVMGALIGALVAGGLVVAFRDDGTTTARSLGPSARFTSPGDIRS